MGRERGRSAIEPVARYPPAAAPARPRAPGESDALSWTPGGGLSPPPVLGAGAARTTSTRCACPPLTYPCPLQPSSLTPRRGSPRTRLSSHAFSRVTDRYDRASRSPRTLRTPSGAAGAPLHVHVRVGGPDCPRAAVIACAVRSSRACVSSPGCTAGTVFAHVEPQILMYMIVLSVVVVQRYYIKWCEQQERSRERPRG